MNVNKSKIMNYSRYMNVDLTNVRLDDKPLDSSGLLKSIGSQVATDSGCERDILQKIVFD